MKKMNVKETAMAAAIVLIGVSMWGLPSGETFALLMRIASVVCALAALFASRPLSVFGAGCMFAVVGGVFDLAILTAVGGAICLAGWLFREDRDLPFFANTYAKFRQKKFSYEVLNRTYEAAKEQQVSGEANITRLDGELASTKGLLTTAQAEGRRLNTELDAKTSELSAANELLGELTTLNSDYVAANKLFEEDNRRLTTLNVDYCAANEQFVQENSRLNLEVARLETEGTHWGEAVSRLEGQLSTATAQAEEANRQVEAARERVNQAIRRVGDAERGASRRWDDLKKAQQTIRRLQAKSGPISSPAQMTVAPTAAPPPAAQPQRVVPSSRVLPPTQKAVALPPPAAALATSATGFGISADAFAVRFSTK